MAKPQNLKDLQKHWYKKLEASGFRDIEQSDSRLKEWDSFYFQTHYTRQIFDLKHHYYYQATQFFNALRYGHMRVPEIHVEVWYLHSEGLGLRQIASCLACRMDVILSKTRYNKDNVGEIIKRLKKAFNVFRRSNEQSTDPNS